LTFSVFSGPGFAFRTGSSLLLRQVARAGGSLCGSGNGGRPSPLLHAAPRPRLFLLFLFFPSPTWTGSGTASPFDFPLFFLKIPRFSGHEQKLFSFGHRTEGPGRPPFFFFSQRERGPPFLNKRRRPLLPFFFSLPPKGDLGGVLLRLPPFCGAGATNYPGPGLPSLFFSRG